MKGYLAKLFIIGVLGFSLTAGSWAKEEEIAVTVYNQNFGFIRVVRDLKLDRGDTEVDFKDVASTIDQTSVHFRSLTDPEGTVILEQNYEYDLVSSQKLYQKYLGKMISVLTEQGVTYSGVLGSFDNSLIVLLDAKKGSPDDQYSEEVPVAMIRQDQLVDIRFPELPEGLITTPTLKWLLQVAKAGTHRVEVSYIAQQMNWHSDYVAVLEADSKQMDLTGWVTVNNQSGTTYKNAKLKLLAGDVNRVVEDRSRDFRGDMRLAMTMEKAAPAVEEKDFFEYHLYTITRPTTLKDRQTKQIEFTQAPRVPVRKLFILESSNPYSYQSQEKLKVDVKLAFKNEKEAGLGIALPKGKVRVFQRDDDGSLEFIGEDQIDHTPKDETIKLQIGKAFDIVGERKRTDFKEDTRYYWESYYVAVRNHKKEPVDVMVKENFFRWNEWTLKSLQNFTKTNSQTVEFPLHVPQDATGEIEYTVRYEKH